MRDSAILVALGGNSISPEGEEGNIPQQFRHTEDTMRELVRAVTGRFSRVIITHGNGPQVGNILLRSEYSTPILYPLPLDTCVSDSEGGMGYMIQQVLHNVLRESGLSTPVVSILTQTVVGRDDPAWTDPCKFIGQFYDEPEARKLMAERAWHMHEDAGRGWRRVVPSPMPIEIVEIDSIRVLLEKGIYVIAGGGGGIPVVRDEMGRFHGVEAVVDKDLASRILCSALGIGTFVILTGVEKVALDYGKPTQRFIDRMTADEAEGYLAAGQFPAGSMGPKIRASIDYIRAGGGQVVISNPSSLSAALSGETGTVISAA